MLPIFLIIASSRFQAFAYRHVIVKAKGAGENDDNGTSVKHVSAHNQAGKYGRLEEEASTEEVFCGVGDCPDWGDGKQAPGDWNVAACTEVRTALNAVDSNSWGLSLKNCIIKELAESYNEKANALAFIENMKALKKKHEELETKMIEEKGVEYAKTTQKIDKLDNSVSIHNRRDLRRRLAKLMGKELEKVSNCGRC